MNKTLQKPVFNRQRQREEVLEKLGMQKPAFNRQQQIEEMVNKFVPKQKGN